MKTILIITAILLTSAFLMSFALRAKTERQSFQVIKKEKDLEIRFYPKAIMATVNGWSETYMGNSNDNFRKLAGYIFGGNSASTQIAMTAPVHIEKMKGNNRMSFVMPAGYNMQNLPAPADSTVKLHYSEEGYFAVVKFGGYASDKIIAEKQKELAGLVEKAGLKSKGNPIYLGYNAPWDFINRENEVLVQIEYTVQ